MERFLLKLTGNYPEKVKTWKLATTKGGQSRPLAVNQGVAITQTAPRRLSPNENTYSTAEACHYPNQPHVSQHKVSSPPTSWNTAIRVDAESSKDIENTLRGKGSGVLKRRANTRTNKFLLLRARKMASNCHGGNTVSKLPHRSNRLQGRKVKSSLFHRRKRIAQTATTTGPVLRPPYNDMTHRVGVESSEDSKMEWRMGSLKQTVAQPRRVVPSNKKFISTRRDIHIDPHTSRPKMRNRHKRPVRRIPFAKIGISKMKALHRYKRSVPLAPYTPNKLQDPTSSPRTPSSEQQGNRPSDARFHRVHTPCSSPHGRQHLPINLCSSPDVRQGSPINLCSSSIAGQDTELILRSPLDGQAAGTELQNCAPISGDTSPHIFHDQQELLWTPTSPCTPLVPDSIWGKICGLLSSPEYVLPAVSSPLSNPDDHAADVPAITSSSPATFSPRRSPSLPPRPRDDQCPKCYADLPEEPSELLETLRAEYIAQDQDIYVSLMDQPVDTIENDLCMRHEYEGILLPLAVNSQWPLPENIDFEDFGRRLVLQQVADHLQSIIRKPSTSAFFREYMEKVKVDGRKVLEMRYRLFTIEKEGVGYYGMRGKSIIFSYLTWRFKEEEYDTILFYPMAIYQFMEIVLLREAGLMLIQEDLRCGVAKAMEVLKTSGRYGWQTFLEMDDDPVIEQVRLSARAVNPIEVFEDDLGNCMQVQVPVKKRFKARAKAFIPSPAPSSPGPTSPNLIAVPVAQEEQKAPEKTVGRQLRTRKQVNYRYN